jgi:hypothetical protein
VCALDYLADLLSLLGAPGRAPQTWPEGSTKEGMLQAIRETMCVCGVDAVVVKSEERRWCVLEKTCVRVVVVENQCD